VSRQSVDVERLAGASVSGRGDQGDGDLVLAGRHGGGGGAGDAVVRADQDAGADFGNDDSSDVDRE
jgi:hypothetical protein